MQAIIDLEELQTFIHAFASNCGQLREQKDYMNQKFRELQDYWKDNRYSAFEQKFNETVREIEQFLHNSEIYLDYLERKGRKIQEYLDGY
jgi:uncharacterized protein YukE